MHGYRQFQFTHACLTSVTPNTCRGGRVCQPACSCRQQLPVSSHTDRWVPCSAMPRTHAPCERRTRTRTGAVAEQASTQRHSTAQRHAARPSKPCQPAPTCRSGCIRLPFRRRTPPSSRPPCCCTRPDCTRGRSHGGPGNVQAEASGGKCTRQGQGAAQGERRGMQGGGSGWM